MRAPAAQSGFHSVWVTKASSIMPYASAKVMMAGQPRPVRRANSRMSRAPQP